MSGGSKLDVVVAALPDNKGYVAHLINTSDGKALLTGGVDPNPAIAVHQLFDKTAEGVGKLLANNEGDDSTAKVYPPRGLLGDSACQRWALNVMQKQ